MQRSMRCVPPRLSCLALAALLAGCGWPRDPEHTTERVSGKVLRAGVSENPPWIRIQGGEVSGIDAELIRAVAADAGARVAWRPGGESALMKDLKEGRLDVVAGGITSQSPWVKEMGAPRAYATVAGEKHLVLAPPGENGWIMKLEAAAHAHHSEIETSIAQATAQR